MLLILNVVQFWQSKYLKMERRTLESTESTVSS